MKKEHYLYGTWSDIKKRCLYPKYKQYYLYGGRGIKICDRWLESFENFLEDMGERPSQKHSIERINNDGDYEPSNCRWATKKEQSRNKRNNRMITFEGKTLCIADWADLFNLNYATLLRRIKAGWNINQALNKTPRVRIKFLTYENQTLSLIEWSKKIGIPYRTLSERVSRGWLIEESLTLKNKIGNNTRKTITMRDEILKQIKGE